MQCRECEKEGVWMLLVMADVVDQELSQCATADLDDQLLKPRFSPGLI